ncbi:MAG: flagellar hook protein FlgE [Myxococcales bacterium]|nr:flagellar hook protein FlgE [Myxococcales bacterium]
MSLTSAMWAGLSGLNATATSMSVTGDNIANINTVGYRGSRAQFEDMLTRSIFGVGQIGTGARISSVQKLFEQGSIVGTTSSSDMAITGRGFFVMRGNFNGQSGQFFTRAGEFVNDKEGYLVNPQGLRVQGYNADPAGNISTNLADLLAAEPTIAAKQTDLITMQVNLTAYRPNENPNVVGARVLNAGETFDPADPDATAFFSTGLTVYDSLGKAHPITVYFTRTGERSYEFHGVVESSRLAANPNNTNPGGVEVFASGQLDFNADGTISDYQPSSSQVTFTGANQQDIVWDFGDPTSAGGTGEGSTNTGTASSDNIKIQNGYTAGAFIDMAIDGEGIVTSVYSNSHAKVVGRVALADFRAQEGLQRLGGTLFQQTAKSGEPFIGYANTGGRGQIIGESLEQSNIDISTEFITLIRDQRHYQATTRVITTADELLVETVNLKR